MSRSVSAPSSVTKTSPCWNGDIVPGSTFRYGSNFCSWTRRPRAFSKRPSEAATIPLPSAETTPPVTKTYFGPRALTGFQGSRVTRRHSRLDPGLHEIVEAGERLVRERAADGEERRVDHERRLGLPPLDVGEVELRVEVLSRQLEGEPAHRHDLEDEQLPGGVRLLQEARPVGAEHLPPRARGQAATVGLHAGDAGEPVGEVERLRDERPDVPERREQGALSCEAWQGTPGRRASARARPCARRRRAARCACASGRRPPSRRGSGGRRARRSAAGA